MGNQIDVLVHGRLVNAGEWRSWWEQGLGVREIAKLLGVSVSCVEQVSRVFRDAGVSDPLYRKRKPGPPGGLDTATDAGAYVLGILWGTLSTADQGYWVRHRDRWYIDMVRDYLGITVVGHGSYSKTGDQWRLKITRAVDVALVREILETHGWAARNASERPFPSGPVNERGFIRAWVELHSSADIARIGQKRKPMPRLRIYGNAVLIAEINRLLSVMTGVPERAIQKTTNEITKTLYYTGSSFSVILEWLYREVELTNLEARKGCFAPISNDFPAKGKHEPNGVVGLS